MELVDNQNQQQEMCPYMERLGICLEPFACQYCHIRMNVNAKEFIPNFEKMKISEDEPKDVGTKQDEEFEQALGLAAQGQFVQGFGG